MGRKVDEWKGRTDETPVPPRVKLRICARQNDCCDECSLPFDVKRKPEFDHRPALINGGENRESKIVAVCSQCHKARTKADVGEKSLVNGIRAKRLRITGPKRPFPKRADPWGKQWRASLARPEAEER